MRSIRLVTESFAERPALDTAVSRALLRQVSTGDEPETLRLYRPADVVAFGPQDTRAEGYADAVLASRERGFEAIQRLAGGRAAVFHGDTLAFSWTIPVNAASPHDGVMERFDEIAGLMARAFRSLGVDAHVGEVSGEYCPGRHSVNARGETKLMGVGQRLIRKAAHVGGVVVVDGVERINDVLTPVYSALDIDWRPESTGSLRTEVGPVLYDDVKQAVLNEFAVNYELYEGNLSPDTLTLAKTLEPEHIAPLSPTAP
ncbi:MAG: lipoate--protein ligase family protein [Chloroflexi bacterium]|nr:lipoate--protein ligase family protein [Chloroflexota bacterium]